MSRERMYTDATVMGREIKAKVVCVNTVIA